MVTKGMHFKNSQSNIQNSMRRKPSASSITGASIGPPSAKQKLRTTASGQVFKKVASTIQRSSAQNSNRDSLI
jgi:hypothetical protein